MKGFVDPCKQSSFVVMDAAPVGPVIDSVILSQPVDKVVFVVRWASTARELVSRTLRRLPRDKLAGMVFNRVNKRAARKYGKYAYMYYYRSRDFEKYYSEDFASNETLSLKVDHAPGFAVGLFRERKLGNLFAADVQEPPNRSRQKRLGSNVSFHRRLN